MSQPMDRTCTLPQVGEVDLDAGEFWTGNGFQIASKGENLSAYERNCVFMNFDGESFIDGSFSSGADVDSDSRSVMATDFNNDGSIDLLVGSVGGGPLRLFLNRMPQRNRLRIELEGTQSNRLGIGTRIIAKAGERQVVRDVFPANGFAGQAPAHVDLGIGDAERVDLTVRWPSGQIQSLQAVPTGTQLKLVESAQDTPASN
ncbi:MAG: ASPIC/UnbV domain-containing protein [Planctomycetota bacterium]|nr:ASPIC/UnbV domain-containing protein [Planctomycetota bacterium]MDA1251677.1 ASPIC/UnbV domain-containing protein [Planctomycetota bacterium]